MTQGWGPQSHNRELGIAQARNLGELASLADGLRNAHFQIETQQVGGRCAEWLRSRCSRMERWPAGAGAKVPLNRLRLLSLQMEKALQDLIGAENSGRDRDIAEARQRLGNLLEAQTRRQIYDELVMVLHQLAATAPQSGSPSPRELYAEMASRLEVRLDRGELDSVDSAQLKNDTRLLVQFEQKLESYYG